jgi:hypothetical protein
LVLTKAERSKINKNNRKTGYRAEYDSVVLLRNCGCWAKRLKSREQKGEMSPVDGYYWNPTSRKFGFFTTKVRKNLITESEIESLIFLSKKYRCEILFFWRDKGMKFDIIQ